MLFCTAAFAQNSLKQGNNTVGFRYGYGGGIYVPEIYFRKGLGEKTRVYSGFGWWPGSGEREGSFNNRRVPLKFKGNEFQLPIFLERHKPGIFCFYGGLGVVPGYYDHKFDSSSHFYGSSHYHGFGLDYGIQFGAELKLGAIVIDFDTRLAYYTRYWNVRTQRGLAGTNGINVGIAF